MKIEQKLIEELKKKYGEIYEGEIKFDEENGKHHAVAFIFRKPKR
jgi:hypothetical protein